MKIMTLRLALGLLAIAAPTTAQTNPDLGVDLGPEPSDPIAATKRLMVDRLRDPDSAQYRFMGLHPARCKGGWLRRGSQWRGYAATVEINAKNAMGGYTGFTTYTVLFTDGAAANVIEGINFGEYGPSKGALGLGGGGGVCRFLDH